MRSKNYGYIRVSTKEQNEDRQVLAMKKVGIEDDKIFTDKQSGKDFFRPNYLKLVDMLEPEDVVFVKSIDRLGRNYVDILEQWRIITKEKKADIVVIDMPLLNTRRGKDLIGTLISDIVLQLLSFVAQNERDLIRKRQAEGIVAAKLKGVKFGRPKKVTVDEFEVLFRMYEKNEKNIKEIVSEFNISKSTFYRKLREYRGHKKRNNTIN